MARSFSRWTALFASSTLCLLVVSGYLVREAIRRGGVFGWGTQLTATEVLRGASELYDMFTPVPDHGVGMTFRPELTDIPAWKTRVALTTNRAGLRYPREMGAKPAGTFRVVLLGDSFVAATAAPYEDGAAPQLEAMLNAALRPSASCQRVEVLPIGVEGWNVLAEVNYLEHNLADLAPDLVLHAVCDNDLDSGFEFVLGHVRSQVGDNQRAFGDTHFSTVAAAIAARRDTDVRNLLASYLIPESRRRYAMAALAMQRLRDLLAEQGTRYALFLLSPDALAYGVQQAWLPVVAADDVMLSPRAVNANNLLPLDGHPNRIGYHKMAIALARYIAARGIVAVDGAALEGDPEAPLTTLADQPADRAATQRYYQSEQVPAELRIDAGAFTPPAALRCVVGGLYYDGVLSTRTALVLRRPAHARRLLLELEFPAKPALRDGHLDVHVDGKPAAQLRMDAQPGAVTSVDVALADGDEGDLVEVVLEADRYFTTLEQSFLDGVFGPMPRCGRLHAARLAP